MGVNAEGRSDSTSGENTRRVNRRRRKEGKKKKMTQTTLSEPPRPSLLRSWKAAVIFTRSPESAARERNYTKNRALPPGYKFEKGLPTDEIGPDIPDQYFMLLAADGAPILVGKPGNDVTTTIRCLFDGAGVDRGTIEGSFEGYAEREVPDDLKKWIILDVRLRRWYRAPADAEKNPTNRTRCTAESKPPRMPDGYTTTYT